MQFDELKFDEEPLSREELLTVIGGANASYTAYGTNCVSSGSNSHDCSDGGTD